MNSTMMPPQQAAESITLYYREGGSDKVYQCHLEPSGDLFVVHFAYGRRGTTLQTGTKTSSPVEYEAARNIYDKLVREKMAKGYTPGEEGTPYQHTSKEDRATNILPQLLNPIEESEVQRLISQPGWCLQEKKDGRRILVQKAGAAIHGINRKGLLVGLPSPILVQVQTLPTDVIIDGECVGDILYAFDVLRVGDEDLRNQPYENRWERLTKLLEPAELTHVELVDSAFTPARKALLHKRLQADKREGVVLKRLDAPYTPGRPASGGPQLK